MAYLDVYALKLETYIPIYSTFVAPMPPPCSRKTILSVTATLQDNDILCGKNKNFHLHPGNKIFRQLITDKVDDYIVARTKGDKMKITNDIVSEMKQRYGSRFLRKAGDQVWHEISDSLARDKVSHAIKFAAKRRQKRNAEARLESTAAEPGSTACDADSHSQSRSNPSCKEPDEESVRLLERQQQLLDEIKETTKRASV